MVDIDILVECDPEAQEAIQETEDFLNGYCDLEEYASLDDFKEEIQWEIYNNIEE